MDNEEQSSMGKLRRKLYARKQDESIHADIRTPLSQEEAEAPVAWEPLSRAPIPESPMRPTGEVKEAGYSTAAKFFMGSALFFIGAAAIASFIFFFGGNLISPQNIDMQIVAPSLIDGGKEATFQVIIENKNTTTLELADLIITYPEGTRNPAEPQKALTHSRESIGTIGEGEQIKRSISGIFFGQEGTQQTIKVTLQYSVAGSNAVFQKEEEATFLLGSSPVSLSVQAPEEVIAGEPFDVTINVRSNTTEPIANVVLQGQYPFGFTPTRTNPQAAPGGTLWRLGTLEPGKSQTIRLTGTIEGQDGDERVFRFLAGSNADQTESQIQIPFLSIPTTVSVRKPFISGAITVDGKSGKTVSIVPGKTVQGTVSWQNNLSDPVSDVEIRLSLQGPILDKSSVDAANGFYQSSNSTIIWTKDQDPSLVSVTPGGTATMQFSFATLPPGTGGTVYSNPVIDLNLNIQGVRTGEGAVPQQISSAASMQVSFASALSLEARAQHFSGPYSNSGPMPPTVDNETTYTVAWTVKNSSNTLANASVSAVLPSYVRFIKGQSGISYDEGSRTVTWNIGDLKAGVGYNLPAQGVAFQVEFTPSLSQVGESPALTGNALFVAQDRFAQVTVQASAGGPTIRLSGEGGYDEDMGTVSE